jgi:hypothetical protein
MSQIAVYLVNSIRIISCHVEMAVDIAGHHEMILAVLVHGIKQPGVTSMGFGVTIGKHAAYVKIPRGQRIVIESTSGCQGYEILLGLGPHAIFSPEIRQSAINAHSGAGKYDDTIR